MGDKIGRPKAGQAPLNRDRILSAALGLVDKHGMKAFSMRRLAAELGVDPMAIYYHLPNKQAILAGLVERVCGELRLPPAGSGTWADRVRAVARAYHGLVRAHPELVLYLVTDRQAAAVAALTINEALYEALAEAGLPPRQIVRAADLVVDYVNGYALGEVSGAGGQPGEWPELNELLAGLPAGQFPALRRVIGGLTPEETGGDFGAGLEIILAGIAAIAAG